MRVQIINRIPRVGQMCGVLVLAFGLSIVGSLMVLSGARSLSTRTQPLTSFAVLYEIAYQILCLLLLYLILLNQKRGLSSIGFTSVTIADVLHSVVLFFGGLLSSAIVYELIAVVHQALTGEPLRQWDGAAALFGSRNSVLPFLFVLLNPFFEELLVRGYLMTEIQEQFGHTRLAVVASVGLQASYHLYQGIANATALAAVFTCYAMYFSRTKRIVPVILAHMYFDVIALVAYARP